MEVRMDAAQLGNRLRAARERRGLSQQAVADALGLPRTAITNMETGARAVSTLEITKLADLYGQTPAYFLAPNEQEAEDLLVVLHRAAPEIEGTPEIKTRLVASSISTGKEPALRGLLDQASEQTVPNYASKLSVALATPSARARRSHRKSADVWDWASPRSSTLRRRSANKASGRRRRTCPMVSRACS